MQSSSPFLTQTANILTQTANSLLTSIVVLKRHKRKSHAPGSASAPTGLTAGPLHPSNMKRNLCSNTTTKGFDKHPVTTQLLGAAVRYMHKILLRDLRPPWMDHQFTQALPGEGVLSRFTRPSFLQWEWHGSGKRRFSGAPAVRVH